MTKQKFLNKFSAGAKTCAAALAAITLLSATAACGGEKELTDQERLERIAGRTLTLQEVEEQQSVARVTCKLDDSVAQNIWAKLETEEQLLFQDFVIERHCPDKAVVYANVTGRALTDEAKLKATTSTAPNSTSSTSGPSTSATATTSGSSSTSN